MISRKDIQATCDDIVRAFAPERVIMVDARGHGLSDKPDTNDDTKTHAADLAGLIRALDLQKPNVMGHSMGAGIAATLAADYPDLSACIILEDPPWQSDLLSRTAAGPD